MSDSSYIENKYSFSVVDGSLDDVILDFPKQINSAEYTYSDEPYYENIYDFHIYGIPTNFNGELKYFVDGKEVDGYHEGGNDYLFSYDDFAEGNHEFTVYYGGDEYFGELNISSEFLVAPITFNIYSDMIEFNHIYDAKGNLIIMVNGNLYKNLTISDSPYPYPVYRVSDGWRYYENYGHFILYNTTFVYLDLNDGDEVEAIYEGNYGKYITVDTISSSEDEGPYYNIIINNTECLYGEGYLSGKDYTQIILPDIDDINVTVSIDGEESVFHDRCINISNLSFGSHNVSVDYSGDARYPSKSFDFTINVYGRALINYDADLDGLVTYDAGDRAEISLTLPADAEGNFTVYYKNGSKYKVYKTVELKDGKASIVIKGIAGYVNPSKTIGVNYFKTKFFGNYNVIQDVYKVIFVPETYEKKMVISIL